jgi:hypothetical protein
MRPTLILALLICLPASLVACAGGSGIPTDNVRDYHVTFVDATASESCTDDMKAEADGHEEFSETYRIHWVDGWDEARVDLYWKARGDADNTFQYFAAGTQEGTLDEGAITYAGGTYEEDKESGRVSYRIEGRASTRFGDTLPNSTEEYVITDSTEPGNFPIGCVFTLHYEGNLASEQDDL